MLTVRRRDLGRQRGYADTLSPVQRQPRRRHAGDDVSSPRRTTPSRRGPIRSRQNPRCRARIAATPLSGRWACTRPASPVFGLLSCDLNTRDTCVCYNKTLFKLNAPYLATSRTARSTTTPAPRQRRRTGSLTAIIPAASTAGSPGTSRPTTPARWPSRSIITGWTSRRPRTRRRRLTGTIASSGGGTVTVTDGSVFQSTSTYPYFLIGGTEAVTVTSVSGNNVTYSHARPVRHDGAVAQLGADDHAVRLPKPPGRTAGRTRR